jgi:hypothetical protein
MTGAWQLHCRSPPFLRFASMECSVDFVNKNLSTCKTIGETKWLFPKTPKIKYGATQAVNVNALGKTALTIQDVAM